MATEEITKKWLKKVEKERKKRIEKQLVSMSDEGLPEGKGISLLRRMAEIRVLERYRHEFKFYRGVEAEYWLLKKQAKEALEFI